MTDQPACCGMAHTKAVEDALRTIFVRSGRGEPISTSALAAHLGVTPPTVSAMLKRLTEHGLLERADDHSALLTPHGRKHAQEIVRRHRLLETFLVAVLDLTWDEVYSSTRCPTGSSTGSMRCSGIPPATRMATRSRHRKGCITRSGARGWTWWRRVRGSASSGSTTATARLSVTWLTSAYGRV